MKDNGVSNNVGEIFLNKDYLSLDRWVSYFYQIKLLLNIPGVENKKILEIGIGGKIICQIVKRYNLDISTCDINEKLLPDCVADAEKLPYKDNSFGVIMCYEVLEHLPLTKLKYVLKELSRVTSSYVIISLPYSGFCFSGYFKPPFSEGFVFRIPALFRRPESLVSRYNLSHHWALGEAGASIRAIRRLMGGAGFEIIKEIVPPLNSHHQFWVLKTEK